MIEVRIGEVRRLFNAIDASPFRVKDLDPNAEARLFDRLSTMPVRILYTANARAEAWRRDWPAVSAAQRVHA